MATGVAFGSVLLIQGDLVNAIDVLTTGHRFARTHWREDLIGVYSSELRVVGASSLANAWQLSGYPEQAVRFRDEAMGFVRRVSPDRIGRRALWRGNVPSASERA